MRYSRILICWLVSTSTLAFAEGEPEYYLDQFAPSAEERAGWQEARQLFNEFVATPEFIGREVSEQDINVRADLDKACTYEIDMKGCQAYIRQHRFQILTALPDNPLYWQRFWALLQVNPHTFLDSDDRPDYQRLMPATYWWFYRDLARDGRLEIDDALALQTGLNHWLKSHHTLIGRMMTIAMRGIAFRQINYAMAQASRDRDESALRELTKLSAMRPFEEVSFGKMLWMEREYGVAYLEKIIASPEWQSADIDTLIYERPPELDPKIARELLANPVAFQKSDADIFAKHYVAESFKPWGQYWSEGVAHLSDEGSGLSLLNASSATAYTAYLATDRYSNFIYTVFAALSDIYTGRASPGLPGRPPPTHWRWEWQEDAVPMICLVSETLHPTTRQGTEEDGVAKLCLEYFDEQFVSAFID